ncbi:MAG TPA: CHAD domain-containing protein [Candidatus Dormibacteraeota bacterium]|jgi:CHAD domain-containing protein
MQETITAGAAPAVMLSAPPSPDRVVTPVVWDTPDLRLARWGVRLSHQEGEGWTVELPAEGEGPADRLRRVEGDGDAVPDVARDLVAAYARTAELLPRLERGEAPPPEVEVEEVGRRSTAAAVVRRSIATATLRLVGHDAGVRLGGDPEAVHQARVAVRRLRSDLRTFAPLLIAGWSDPLGEELRWIGGELGRVRDAEVLAEEMERVVAALPEADLERGAELAAGFRAEILRAREQLVEAMRSPRYLELLERLVEASYSPMLLPEADQPAGGVLPGLVRRPWRKLRRDARRLRRDGATDVELHRLRIRAKRARYAAEAGAPVLGKRASAFAKAVAGVQEVLGTHHDAVVAAERLRVQATGGGEAAFVAGQLWGVEQARAASARADWPAAWKRARRRRLRSWM